MRFKDYIVKRAIKINFDTYVNQKESSNKIMDKVFTNVSKKLGYKILDSITTKKDVPCKNTQWKNILSRYAYGDRRFLEYNKKNKFSIYFDEKGVLYSGNGSTFTQLSPLEYFDIYGEYSEFLKFSKEYFKESIKEEKQYLLIGYDKSLMYFVCSDGKFYYKESESGGYIQCDKNEDKKIDKYLVELGY